jgi:hypothetical protein
MNCVVQSSRHRCVCADLLGATFAMEVSKRLSNKQRLRTVMYHVVLNRLKDLAQLFLRALTRRIANQPLFFGQLLLQQEGIVPSKRRMGRAWARRAFGDGHDAVIPTLLTGNVELSADWAWLVRRG